MAEDEGIDPTGVIAEGFAMDGLGLEECRSIFLDWVLSLKAPATPEAAIPKLLDRHGDQPEDHPMKRVLREGLEPAPRGGRRGGRSARRPS